VHDLASQRQRHRHRRLNRDTTTRLTGVAGRRLLIQLGKKIRRAKGRYIATTLDVGDGRGNHAGAQFHAALTKWLEAVEGHPFTQLTAADSAQQLGDGLAQRER
jgi:hypothetical protein